MFGTSSPKTATSLEFMLDDEDVLSFDEGKKLTTNTLKPETCLPFLNSGECSDEVELSFDDGEKLYVSENFLCYASPVFKAMFQHDFKEKETKEVAMKEKVFDDVLEFLLCLHPGVQKPIDNENVLRVVSFAEEYQVEASVKKCQKVMKNWLSSEVECAVKTSSNLRKAAHAKTWLEILTKSEACGFDELVTYAILVIARFGHEVFTGVINISTNDSPKKEKLTPMPAHVWPTTTASSGFTFGLQATSSNVAKPVSFKDTRKELQTSKPFALQTTPSIVTKPPSPDKECKILFDNLREELKTRLCLQRLKLCDNGEMR